MAKKKSSNKNDINWLQASEFHKSRSLRSRRIDEAKTAKNTSTDASKSWMKNPAKSDVGGIDTKKYKAKSVKGVGLFLKSTFNKVNNTSLKDSDFDFKNDLKAIVTVKPRMNKKSTLRSLQRMIDIRYNNVSVRERKAKKRPNDFWIIVKRGD